MSIADEHFIKETIEKAIEEEKTQGIGSRGYFVKIENGRVIVEEYDKPNEALLR